MGDETFDDDVRETNHDDIIINVSAGVITTML